MAIVPGDAGSSEAQAAFAHTLFDEFVRGGVADLVVCPGSRSTPLVLAALATPGLHVHVRLDERSAGFFAIGRSLSTGRPAAMLVTSGTAAAEVSAAVVEADLANVPLLVVTADRPPELRGVGAPQTIDQVKLFGDSVRRFEDPGVLRVGTEPTWRPLACRLLAAARGAGPVHLNVPLVEPLDAAPSAIPAGRGDGAPWQTDAAAWRDTRAAPSDVFRGRRVLVVAGRGGPRPHELLALAEHHGWAVLADPLSAARVQHPCVLTSFDALLRDLALRRELRPDVVLVVGAPPASKVLAQALESWGAPVVFVGKRAHLKDPSGLVATVVDADPTEWARASLAAAEQLDCPPGYLATWRACDDAAQHEFDRSLDGLTEPGVARLLSRDVPIDVPLVVSSSMPVRDLEWFGARTQTSRVVYSNRGANGIDGVVSTALGVAATSKAVCLLGDLAFLHDAGSLSDGVGAHGGSCVLVVVDNHGGGIFSFLPQRTSLPNADFERVFGTPPTVRIASVARGYGCATNEPGSLDDLRAAVLDGLGRPGVTVVVVAVPDRDENVGLHQRLCDAAAAAARGALDR